MSKTGLKAAILNSRQAMHPCRSDIWVQNSIKAVKWIQAQKMILLSSTGLSTYDLITTLGTMFHIPMHLIIPISDASQKPDESYIRKQYNLQKQSTIQLINTAVDRKLGMKKRDECIISSADILLPVSLRVNSYLKSLIKPEDQKTICNTFSTPYHSPHKSIAYSLKNIPLNDELFAIKNKYLIHWTKCSNGPWPDETLYDYYKAVISSAVYPRTAFDTLKQILTRKKIIASDLHIAGQKAVVAFTNRPPSEMVPLFRWRARHRSMSFEPYGIGIKKELAKNLAISKIRYIEPQYKKQLTVIPAWLSQSAGEKSDWTEEDEYRHPGDFLLNSIPSNKLLLFTRYKKEADQLEKLTGINTVSFIN